MCYIENMKDNVAKQKGLPYSTSRGQEKKNKHNTIKARRQAGRAEADAEARAYLHACENWRGDSCGSVGCD